MITFRQYVQPESLQEAWELNQKKPNVILGGMLWLKMQSRTFGTAIDLGKLNLDRIEEDEKEFKIGAMVRLADLEHHETLNTLYNDSLKRAVEQIVGVQFRNLATVGGSIFGRYGFSDVLTILLALDADVELVKKGRIPLREFAQLPYDRDVLAYIYIPKANQQVHYASIRNQATDFPVLTCAVARTNGKVKAVIGARPKRAIVIDAPGDVNLSNPDSVDAFASYVMENTPTDTNQRGAKEYRSAMCKVLVRRGLKEIENVYGI